MQPIEMDSMRLWILMIAGGVFAIAGILLMFRAKQEGSSARLELFGQKFEASSAGIIVFLIGAAFLAAPVFVPERSASSPPPIEPQGKEGTGSASGTISLPERADIQETEPNQSVHGANPIAVGQTVRGGFSSDDADWYAFPTDASKGREILITFRVEAKGGCPSYVLLDSAENQVGDDMVCYYEISSTKSYMVESDQYYIRVEGGRALYEISLKYQ